MSTGSEIVPVFREALADCKRLYIQAARASFEDHPDADEAARRELIRRMVDLHKGLLIKVYAKVAAADSRLSGAERDLARELVDHIWQQRLSGDELRDVTRRMFQDARKLKWYSLVRPFDQVVNIRNMSADLETAIVRIANLIAKADGTVTAKETNALRAIRNEIEVHLRRISLDDDGVKARRTEDTSIEVSHPPASLPNAQSQANRPLSEAADSVHVASGAQEDETAAARTGESQEQVLEDLAQLIGLKEIKREIHTLTNYLNLQRHRQAAGLPRHALSLHMVFKGNPGTGKTTVARIVGRIFRALGLLQKGHLVETDRSGLVADYAGQTATKTNKKIDEAIDGILFIDEAYSLVSSERPDLYGAEAVQTLVKRMEDDRDRLVVILAGYPGPINQLLESNPGLRSRFNTQMLFPDYMPVDLGRIYQRMCDANHYVVPPAARAKLLLGFQWLYAHRDENFGNGRLVRNSFENSVRQLANRVAGLAPITRELLTVLTAEDIRVKNVPEHVWQKLDDEKTRFSISCENCGKAVHVRCRQLGRRVRCPYCKSRLVADWGTPVGSPEAAE